MPSAFFAASTQSHPSRSPPSSALPPFSGLKMAHHGSFEGQPETIHSVILAPKLCPDATEHIGHAGHAAAHGENVSRQSEGGSLLLLGEHALDHARTEHFFHRV